MDNAITIEFKRDQFNQLMLELYGASVKIPTPGKSSIILDTIVLNLLKENSNGIQSTNYRIFM